MSKVIPFSPHSRAGVRAWVFERLFGGDALMRNDPIAIIVGVGLLAVSSPLVQRGAGLAAQAPHSTAVFAADGKLKLQTGYRRWVFVGVPLAQDDKGGSDER
jgi:hypothetical protein